METVVVAIGIIVVSILAGTGYYLIWSSDREKFESRKTSKTEYRTNEEFIKS